MIAWLTNPTLWFPAALLLATVMTLGVARPRDTGAAMNRYFGIVAATMAIGHVAAIALKMSLGSLSPTTSAFAIPLGFVLGAPAAWLAMRPTGERGPLVLNGVVVGSLVALGASAALAIPGALNLAYAFRPRRAFVVAAIVVYTAMLVGSFFAPGF